MNQLSYIYKRHSIRKFAPDMINDGDLMEILRAAIHAPSGKNLQNWHFVVIKNSEKIKRIATIVEEKTYQLAELTNDESMKKSLIKYLHYHTFFKDAPVFIIVYAGPYPITSYDILLSGGKVEEANEVLKSAPGIQNIAAAMENLQLAAATLGYGTCWMTGPNYAAREIEDYIKLNKEGYYIAAMTPLGIPIESELSSPPRKDIQEVITIID